MTNLLLFFKHKLPFIWEVIESINEVLFKVLYSRYVYSRLDVMLNNVKQGKFSFRRLRTNDIEKLIVLLDNQEARRLAYFKPHSFDKDSLTKLYRKSSFIMMGVFFNNQMIGYFFLRCFWNKKCFVGRLIDYSYEKKGIGRMMNTIMYETAWDSGFRCLSTISQNNKMIMRSHQSNKSMKIIRHLPNNYLLIEFIRYVE